MTCHVTSEQLTKYILYCEWMIYATWRLADSLSSLMQSIGATERVFQLMSLSPGNQYLPKGKHFVLYFRNYKLVLRSLDMAFSVLRFINHLLQHLISDFTLRNSYLASLGKIEFRCNCFHQLYFNILQIICNRMEGQSFRD